MTDRFKPMRTLGTVPVDYDGPVYWRLVHNEWNEGGNPLRFIDSRDLDGRLYELRSRGKTIRVPGTQY
jgi:hypothetical protein